MMQEPVKFIWIKEKLKWGQLLWHWIKQIQQTQYWGLRVTILSSVYLNAVWPVTRTLDGRFQKACRPFFFSEGNMEMPFVPEGLDIWLQSVSWALKQPPQVFLATRLSTSWLMELVGNFHQKVAGVPANKTTKGSLKIQLIQGEGRWHLPALWICLGHTIEMHLLHGMP